MIGEILRVQKLTAKEPDNFATENEKAYLETLRPDQLKLHYDKALEAGRTLKLGANTTGDDAPDDPATDAAFGNVTQG